MVAADDDPSITEGLREQDFYSVVDLLEHHYNLVLMDTGTGVLESAAKGIVELADQLVVVAGPSLDTARTAMSTLDWLGKHGHADLVANAVAVINQVRPEEPAGPRPRRGAVRRARRRSRAHPVGPGPRGRRGGLDRGARAGDAPGLSRTRRRGRGRLQRRRTGAGEPAASLDRAVSAWEDP